MTTTSKKNRFLPLIILAIAAAIIMLLIVTKPTPPKQETKEQEWLISSTNIQLGNTHPQINLLGTVESPFDTTISSAISADVLSVPVRDGQVVKQGDILIQLDKREVNLALQQRQADVAELKAQIKSESNRYQTDLEALKEEEKLLSLAEQGVKRQAKLQASNLVAQERYDNAESSRAQQALSISARKLNIADHPSRLQQLKARLTRAQTALKDAEIDIEKASIKAPYDGIITGVNVAPGERVQIGQALVSLYDNLNMEVRAQIPDKYVNFINQAIGNKQTINATTLSYGRSIELRLVRLSGQANLKNGGVDAIFTPNNTSDILILNNAVQVQVNLPELKDVFSLPVSAIYGTNRVYRVEDGRLQAIEVDIQGYRYDEAGKHNQVIFSSKLLNSGDQITITQLPNAISGLKVKTRGGQE